jgi:6-phosphogluconolactonase
MAHHVNKDILILHDMEELSQRAASMFIEHAKEKTEKNEKFFVALSGGTTPKRLYEILASKPFRKEINWNLVEVYFSDERCVPPEHEQSNFRMANEALIRHVPAHVHRIEGEIPPEEASIKYEQEVKDALGPAPRFDLILLGLGPDGHVASLFPGSPLLKEDKRIVREFYSDKLKSWRVTLTLQVINQARHVLFLVTGKTKAQALKEIVVDEDEKCPGTLVQPLDGEMTWLVDHKAAEGLGDVLLA